MPGSSIEKIEVMTNPPPQYANEQGGVINIVTRKGKVGKTGRLNLSGGTRGETAISGNYTYRRQGFVLAINGGVGYSRFEGNGYSYRNNIYTDSSNFFNTRSSNMSKNVRPNFRVNVDYDFSKFHSLNAVLQLNSSDYLSRSATEYRNINRFGDTWRLSERTINNEGNNYNGSFSLSYLLKTKTPGVLFFFYKKKNAGRTIAGHFIFQPLKKQQRPRFLPAVFSP
jgi:outer membrane receptor for ferrienterochelin and colicin